MEDLVTELKLWIDTEKAMPDKYVPNDYKLLQKVQEALCHLRKALPKKENINNPELWAQYRELSDTYDTLLNYRVAKNADLLKRGLLPAL
jgi:hypothetical protein